MIEPNELKAALERLISGGATDDDRRSVQSALLAGRIVHATGERGVGIGGDATGAVIITGDVKLQLPLPQEAYEAFRKKLFPAPQGIPPPFPDLIFIGREEAVHEVKSILGTSHGAATRQRTAIVRGWPGVGKTTLVSVLARDPDVARTYPDGVLWTSLEQKPALISILAGWGRALGREDLLRAPSPERAAEQVRELLEQKRMLLIVDDVWEASHGALFIGVRGHDCGLLFTTRLTEVAEVLALDSLDEQIYKLGALTVEDAMKLMLILAPTVVGQYPNECRELVNDLERLPLALHVAARLLTVESKYGWGVSDLLRDIRSGAAIIAAEAPADRIDSGRIPTVSALLKKSTDMLDEHTRESFAYLGAFAPKPATFDSQAMKAVWQVEDARPTIRELVGRGLLEPAGADRFQMHALLVAHARSLLVP